MMYNSKKSKASNVIMEIINEERNIIEDNINGILWAYPQLKQVVGTFGLYDANFCDDQIPLISGGGSGHDPADWGYVGKGMLTAAVMGKIFIPPTKEEIVKVTKKVTKQKKAFYIVKNFMADVHSFDGAKKELENAGWQIGMCIVADDISVESLSLKKRKRGVAGTILVQKILGVAAEHGANIEELNVIANQLRNCVKTIGVAFGGSKLPGREQDDFTLASNEIYYGIGIHGEPGYCKEIFKSSELLAHELISKLKLSFHWKSGDKYALLINSLGGTTVMESMIFNNDVRELLSIEGLNVSYSKVGRLLTSNGMHGISLTLLHLEKPNWVQALKFSVDTPNWLA